MDKSIPSSECLRRVMNDSDDEFSSSDNEFIGDLKIAGEDVIGIGLGCDLEESLIPKLDFWTPHC